MINKLTHVTIYVSDYDKALVFYRDTLGFKVTMDQDMGNGARWLTVSPAEQPELQFVLYKPAAFGNMDAETAAHLNAVLAKGMMGGGVMTTDDCRKTYAELKAKGVEFMQEPKQMPYGLEALFKDTTGTWFSLVQTG
jgi:predicted enzyme related to lactoylglutathione lyase